MIIFIRSSVLSCAPRICGAAPAATAAARPRIAFLAIIPFPPETRKQLKLNPNQPSDQGARHGRSLPLRRRAGAHLRFGPRRASGRAQAEPLDVVRLSPAWRARAQPDGDLLRDRDAGGGAPLSRP